MANANGRTKVTSDQVLKYIKDEKRTIKQIATNFTVTAATARKHVSALIALAAAEKAGTVPLTGERGRAANLYKARQA